MSSPARRSTPGTASSRLRTHRTGVVRADNLRRGTPRTSGLARGLPGRPDLWLVPAGEPARRTAPRTRRAPFVVLVLVLLVGTTLGLLVLNTAIAVDSLKATHLRTENAHRVQDIQRLEQRVVNGSTPERLAEQAKEAGMVPAGPPAYLVIEPDGSSTVRGTPQPAPGTAGGN